jgi:outer membrane receptor protein involved in Fe transport
VSNLKLRGSWGKLGNQNISPYSTLARVVGGANYPYNGGGSYDVGYIVNSAANSKLKWESTQQINVGLDLGLFKSRLTATIDLYKKTTKDLLFPITLPSYTGIGGSGVVPSVMTNVGSMENKGIEISVGGDPVDGNFKWNTSFIVSINRSKILDLGKDNNGDDK